MTLHPRPLPSETITGLVPPLAGFPFFAYSDHFPFQEDATEYSAVNAWWLADASFLVYGTAEFVEQSFLESPLPGLGFRIHWLGGDESNRGLVLQNDRVMVIAFRGTRFQSHTLMDVAELVLIHEDDLWTDSQFLPAVCRCGGRVHQGFRDVFVEINGPLTQAVRAKRRDQRLWLTGHSMGGALATLAAAHMEMTPIHGLYTFGCPRVGDEAFVSALPRQSHYRFVHRDDWVPTVPPELLGFVHGGALHTLPGTGLFAAGPRKFWENITSGADLLGAALKSMASQLRVDVGKLPFKVSGLTDHAIVYYATHLWNNLIAAQGREGSASRLQ